MTQLHYQKTWQRLAVLASMMVAVCAHRVIGEEPSATGSSRVRFQKLESPPATNVVKQTVTNPPAKVQESSPPAGLQRLPSVNTSWQSEPLPSPPRNPENIVPKVHSTDELLQGGNPEPSPESTIDLASALALVGVQNPEFLLAQQRVIEANALRQLAAVQILPTLNVGTNLDAHWGVLQQSNGNILNVNREALFVGAGANAIAAGTVNIPGVVWNLNVSDSIFTILVSRQVLNAREYGSAAALNDVQLRVVTSYLELIQAEAMIGIARQSREYAELVAKTTDSFARVGQGRQADADRAATEFSNRKSELIAAEASAFAASANLAREIGLDTTIRLRSTDNYAVPHAIVPEPIPLRELLAISLVTRPELQERQAAIRESLLALQGARILPFSPNVMLGFSAGSFGGGSNLASAPVGTSAFARGQDRFGNFGDRNDLDGVIYWTLRNLSIGNRAQIAAAHSRVHQANWNEIIVLDRIRAEVAMAHARVHSRYAQIDSGEIAVRSAMQAWNEDLARTRANEGLAVEVLDSLRLLATSRTEYLKSIIEYNRAQFELYQALGNPPANLLVRFNAPPEAPPNVPNNLQPAR